MEGEVVEVAAEPVGEITFTTIHNLLVPGNGIDENAQATTTTTAQLASGSADDESRTIWMIIVALAVVGVLVAVLTWRYWLLTRPDLDLDDEEGDEVPATEAPPRGRRRSPAGPTDPEPPHRRDAARPARGTTGPGTGRGAARPVLGAARPGPDATAAFGPGARWRSRPGPPPAAATACRPRVGAARRDEDPVSGVGRPARRRGPAAAAVTGDPGGAPVPTARGRRPPRPGAAAPGAAARGASATTRWDDPAGMTAARWCGPPATVR